MKNVHCKIGICALLILISGTVVVAKEWRGIVPLKSTRNDVERLLGRPKRSAEGAAFYQLSKELVVFHFQTETCDSRLGKCSWVWNVPLGTVIGIGVIPRDKHRKEEYLLASDSKVNDNGAGFIYYSDNFAGLSVETYQNLVTLIDYYPEASQDNFYCPRTEECTVDFFPNFDEYQKLSFEDQKARLENLLIVMNEALARGIIEVVGPTKKARQKLMKGAARAKRYLMEKRGLEEERLLLVDGGFSKGPLTRLFLYPIGGPVSRIYLFPEPDPKTAKRRKVS